MDRIVLKIAASGLVLGVTMVGCKPAAMQYRPATADAAPVAPRADDAASLFAKADRALAAGDPAAAVALAEQGVTLSPSDPAYRTRLANFYIRAGRFQSAETAYGDALTLAPGDTRAAMSQALAQIAQGKTAQALGTVDRLAATGAPASDVGLAYALAGQPQRALELLEPAARSDGADARVRQNLALAYALSGDWQKAKVVAAQDLSPLELAPRMRQWAAMASPASSYDQVATLLGVTPAADPGQPIQLALAAPQGPALAEAAPPPFAPEPERFDPPSYAPIPAAAQTFTEEPAPQSTRLTAAVESLVDAEPAPAAKPLPAFSPYSKKPRVSGEGLGEVTPAKRAPLTKLSFVVQLGAFSNAANAERAWDQVGRRYGLSSHGDPLSTTVSIPGRGTFHRLSIAGFDDRGEAARTCEAIRARGGACFVRLNAGDVPLRFASRQTRNRRA